MVRNPASRNCYVFLVNRTDRILTCLALSVSVMGLSVMAGWYLHLRLLIQILPTLTPMQFNTAMGMLVAGIGTALTVAGRRHPASICAVVITALGGLTLIEYCRNVDLRIDSLFFHGFPATVNMPQPSRMSPITAGLFVAYGTSLMLFHLPIARRVRISVASSIALIIVGVSFVVCLGYAAGLPGAAGPARFTSIAPTSALSFLLLGSTLLAVAWRVTDSASRRADRAPLAVAIVSGVVSVGLWGAIVSEERTEENAYMTATTTFARDQIHARILSDMRALRRMASRWEMSGGTAQGEWQSDAHEYQQDMPEFQAVEWIDTRAMRVRWIEPLQGNERVLTFDLRTGDRRANALKHAMSGRITVSRPIDLVQGGKGFLIYIPLTSHGKPDGLLAGVCKLPGIAAALPTRITSRFAIDIGEGGQWIYHSAPVESIVPRAAKSSTLSLGDTDWDIRLTPTEAAVSPYRSRMPVLVLFFGALLSIVLAFLTRAIQRLSETAASLRRAEALSAIAFEHAAIGKSHVSPEGKYLRINPVLCDIVGYSKDELIERDFKSITHPDDLMVGEDLRAKALRGEIDHYSCEKRYIHKNGSTVWIQLTAALLRDEDGQPLFFTSQILDITGRKEASERLHDYAVVLEFQKDQLEQANQELETLATTDSLTGLKNRRALMDRLKVHFTEARRYNVALSFVILDVDNFKGYNDSFGHSAGDDALRAIAAIISQQARDCDFVSRFGGEEFAVACSQTDGAGAMALAERMRAAIETATWDNRPITASFGVAELTLGVDSVDELIHRADEALYRSKDHGRNTVTSAAGAKPRPVAEMHAA